MTFSEKTTLGGGVKTTIEENAGVPLIASAKLTDEFSFTWSHESSKSTTTTIEVDEEITFSEQVTVEQQHCVSSQGISTLSSPAPTASPSLPGSSCRCTAPWGTA